MATQITQEKFIPKENRPKIAVIYSDSDRLSNESKNLGLYFCGQLANTGYTNMYMVGITPDGNPGGVDIATANKKRLTYCPRYSGSNGGKKFTEVPSADVTYSHWDILSECHVIIVTVNSEDTKMCRNKLVDLLDANRQNKDIAVTIFSLQRGVKNSNQIKDAFSGRKDVAVVEGVVGFAVVPHPKSQALMPTVAEPSIIFERLDKEAERVAIGPCNLMEYMDLTIHFRKQLTAYTWGVLVYEAMYALHAATSIKKGQDSGMRAMLQNTRCRLALASMVRESNLLLTKVAQGGKWKPELLGVSTNGSLWLLEMLLCFPTFLFTPLGWLSGMLPPAELCSPIEHDHSCGRTSAVKMALGELCETGERYSIQMPVCDEVLAAVLKAEESPSSAVGGDIAIDSIGERVIARHRKWAASLQQEGPEGVAQATKELAAIGIGAKSRRELRGWLFRYSMYGLLVFVLYVMFVHEHEHEEMLESLPGHLDQEIL